ncbi:MAG: cytidylate kinase-like family protein [Ignavibacteriaceae bacterium]
MLTLGAYEKCKRYIEQHSKLTADQHKRRIVFPCIAVSREPGAGANTVCQKVLDVLQAKTKEPEENWAYFNRKLLEKVLEDGNLPKIVSEYLSEGKYSYFNDAVSELLGIRPSDWTILQKTTETVLQLGRMGKVIIVGRASVIITSKLTNAFHLRLIAPLENRIEHTMKKRGISKLESIKLLEKETEARKKFVRSYFHREIDDPSLYNLILNTGKFTYDEAAEIIANTVIKKFPKCFN